MEKNIQIYFLLKVHTCIYVCTHKYLYVHTLSSTFWAQKVISPNGWHQLFHQVNEEFASFKKQMKYNWFSAAFVSQLHDLLLAGSGAC